MTLFDALYTILIGPLKLLFEFVFTNIYYHVNSAGISIIGLSLFMNFLLLPFYNQADRIQNEENEIEKKLSVGVNHIKKTFKGDQRYMMTQTYYRQNGYKPIYALKGLIPLLLEIPFFIAAYDFLSNLDILNTTTFGPIFDLSKPDGILFGINILPIIMTVVNLISCIIFTKGNPIKIKIRLYAMAIFFLIFLYDSPSGLVFYWTLNNIFSLVKTIFYKLKNPKKVLKIIFMTTGVITLVFTFGFFNTDNYKYKLLLAFLGMAFILPYSIELFKNNSNNFLLSIKLKQNGKVFWVGALYLVVLTGLVIPSAVISASPQEFADVNYFVHPIWYICSSFCFAIGTFLIWFGVFRSLVSDKIKAYFDFGIWAICGIAIVNYMFFGNDLGLINSNLQYENGMYYSGKITLINLAVIAIVAILMLVMYCRTNKLVSQILAVGSVALIAMSCINVYKINSSINEMLPQVQEEENTPKFNLSKTGKNVVVIMLDRAMGEYIPYIMNEKPELKEIYSGFTYYSNVISFGGFTNFGTPALYGGYEYTPVEINSRDDESLASKQNEALKVMPVLFDESGYDVTVCQPTYANYQWTPDLSIYDDYPNIETYNTNGAFTKSESKVFTVEKNKRNFFCFSIVKSSPLIAQPILYNGGLYNDSSSNSSEYGTQTIIDSHKAQGISSLFESSITTLENLDTMTNIIDNDTNTFMMLSNDSTHENTLLQEPEYTASEYVDNTEYDAENAERFIVDDVILKMENDYQYTHYEVNMASLLRIGDWLQYLKDNGVYDNTRIIIVSDHGRETDQIDSLNINEGRSLYDTEFYYPLLMVKDFNSTEFTTSEKFMTNADVPTIAMSDLIDNPTNPFTGKTINDDEKYAHDQYILGSYDFDIDTNNGNKFLPGVWFSVSVDRRDMNNWTILQTNSTSPFENTEE